MTAASSAAPPRVPASEFRSDGQLLEGFTRRREEAAFAALVDRHGPMVLGICRRVLHQAHDAEDAFQATFLALARKAGSISRGESVGGWLYRVAYRLAARLKVRADRRSAEELPALAGPGGEPPLQVAWRELCAVLDEELGRLPAKFRTPLVLCYLRGNTHEETAQELGWPLGTVRSRLARAREILRANLTRRGLALSAAALGTLLAANTAAAVPTLLAEEICRHALLWAGGPTPASAVPAHIAALVDDAFPTTWSAGWNLAARSVVLAGLVAVAAILFSSRAPQAAPPKPVEAPAEPMVTPELLPAPSPLPYDQEPGNLLVRAKLVQTWTELTANSLALSPDGAVLGAARADKGLVLYDTLTGVELEHALFPKSQVATLLVTLDQQTPAVFAACDDFSVHLKVTNPLKKEVKFAAHRDLVKALAVTTDGTTVASGSADRRIQTFRVATGTTQNQFAGHQGDVFWLSFAPDGSQLASVGGDNTVRVWDTATRREVRQLGGGNYTFHAAAFTPEGKPVACGSSADAVVFYEVMTGKEMAQFALESVDLRAVAFSPDARTLATGSHDHAVVLWDVATGKELNRLSGHKGRVTTLTFSANGKKLAAGGDDATVLLWNLEAR
jgi:RNA polymerase sigma factor (sigma-70 family)